MKSHTAGQLSVSGRSGRVFILGVFIVSALAACLAVRPGGTAASKRTQGEGERLLKKGVHRNPVTEIVDLKVKGVPVAFGRKITADDDWLKGLTVTVKNTSSKAIIYLEVELELFGEKEDEVSGRLPVMHPLSYGTYTGNTSGQPPDGPPAPVIIESGGSLDIKLTDEEYASLLNTLSGASYPLTMKHAELTVTDVIFADDTRWYKSMFLQRDPKNPSKWQRTKAVGKYHGSDNRLINASGRGRYGAQAPFFGRLQAPGSILFPGGRVRKLLTAAPPGSRNLGRR